MNESYAFLSESYATEILKALSVWSQFADSELDFRPEPRARSPREHLIHQCASEDAWMRTMLGVDVGRPPLPVRETRLEFLEHYAAATAARAASSVPERLQPLLRLLVEGRRAW